MPAKRINKANNADYCVTFKMYYSNNNKPLIEESLQILKDENVFMSGFIKFILEHPDFVKRLCDKIPEKKLYRKGIF